MCCRGKVKKFVTVTSDGIEDVDAIYRRGTGKFLLDYIYLLKSVLLGMLFVLITAVVLLSFFVNAYLSQIGDYQPNRTVIICLISFGYFFVVMGAVVLGYFHSLFPQHKKCFTRLYILYVLILIIIGLILYSVIFDKLAAIFHIAAPTFVNKHLPKV